ncbi:MAG: hypothetical protein UT59_C0062G0001, partial [candidate division CPR2 bacterium GW2011_GWD1_39_7]
LSTNCLILFSNFWSVDSSLLPASQNKSGLINLYPPSRRAFRLEELVSKIVPLTNNPIANPAIRVRKSIKYGKLDLNDLLFADFIAVLFIIT